MQEIEAAVAGPSQDRPGLRLHGITALHPMLAPDGAMVAQAEAPGIVARCGAVACLAAAGDV